MTNLYFDRLQRDPRFRKKEEQPAAPSGLGAAIEDLIRQQVEEQVAAEAAKQVKPNPAVPEHRRPFTDREEQHTFPPPPPQTKPPLDLTITMERDSAGKLLYATIGGDKKFEIQRNAAGRIIRAVELD